MPEASRHIFTSESVTEGHPDKVSETLVTTDRCVIAGEITTSAQIDYEAVTRQTIAEIGYTDPAIGFDFKTCEFYNFVHTQSPDIAMGVDTGGAGDQGLMFGYACDETPELMPLPIMLSHQLTRRLSDARRGGQLKFLRPDGKSQVSVEYAKSRPARIDAVVVSTQHEEMDIDQLRRAVKEAIIDSVVPAAMVDAQTKFHINPTGRFVVGGPNGDTGVTGRKIIVDTYGGMGRHGGGAFSGKDPTKVDRSACYMARYIAKNIVAAGLAASCEVQLAYAIGVAEPVSVLVNTFGTSVVDEERIVELVRANFPLTPKGMIDHLKLRRPIYRATAAFGHFGRTEDSFSWEKTDKAEVLRDEARLSAQTAANRA